MEKDLSWIQTKMSISSTMDRKQLLRCCSTPSRFQVQRVWERLALKLTYKMENCRTVTIIRDRADLKSVVTSLHSHWRLKQRGRNSSTNTQSTILCTDKTKIEMRVFKTIKEEWVSRPASDSRRGGSLGSHPSSYSEKLESRRINQELTNCIRNMQRSHDSQGLHPGRNLLTITLEALMKPYQLMWARMWNSSKVLSRAKGIDQRIEYKELSSKMKTQI